MFKSRIRATFFAIMLAVPIQGFSQTSAGIKALIQTPASAFDVFLNQLYIKLNGPTYFGKSHLSEGLHVFQLEYDAVSNVIHIGLHLGPENSLIPAFSKLDENGKRDTLEHQKRDTLEHQQHQGQVYISNIRVTTQHNIRVRSRNDAFA